MSLFSIFENAITGTLDTISAGLANPLTLVTKGREAAIQKTFSTPRPENVAKIITTGATLAAVVVGAGAVAEAGLPAAVRAAVGSVVRNPIKSSVAAVVIPAVASSSRLQSTLEDAPGSAVHFGSNLGQFADNPTFDSALNIAKENPLITTALIAAGTFAAGKAIAPAAAIYSNYSNTRAINANTAATELTSIPQSQIVSSPEVVAPISELAAPSATSAPKKPTKKKKKAKKKAKKKTRRSKKKTKSKKKAKKKTIKRNKTKK